MLGKALTLLNDIVANKPENLTAQNALAETAFSMSTYKYVSEDDNLAAHNYALQSIKAYKKSLEIEPNLATERKLIRAQMMSGVPLFWVDRADEGLVILKKAHGNSEMLLEKNPNNTDLLGLNGSINVEIARGLTRIDDSGKETIEDVLAYWDKAIKSRYRQFEINRDDDRPLRSLVILLYERGAAKRWRKMYDAALQDINEAQKIGEKMIKIEPDNARINRMMNGIAFEKARVFEDMGQLSEASDILDDALRIKRTFLVGQENNKGLVREVAY